MTKVDTIATISAADLKKHMPTLKRLKQTTAYLRVDNSDAGATLSVTDFDILATLRLGGHADEAFTRTIDIKSLDIASKSSGAIEFRDDHFATSRGRYNYTGEDDIEDVKTLCVSSMPKGKEFDAKVISTVCEFASKDEHRYTMHSIFFNKDELVATDGKRLIIKSITEMPQFLMPYKLAKVISYLKDLRLTFDGDYCKATSGDLTLVGKQMDGNFPNYRQVLPEDHYDTAWDLMVKDKGELSTFLKTEENDSIEVILNENLVKIKGSGEFVPGNAVLGLPCEGVSLNPKLMLSLINAGVECLEFKDAHAPIIGTAEGLTTLLMPMRK